jgi:hypothetical protein
MQISGPGNFYWGGKNEFQVEAYDPALHKVENEVLLKAGSRTTLMPGMSLVAQKHDFVLEPGAYLEPQGFDADGDRNILDVKTATFQGEIMFPISQIDLDNPQGSLLKVITSPGTAANLEGATISLGNFSYSGMLTGGDAFYLMEADDYDRLTGAPQNSTATAMQNLSLQYTFIIDYEDPDNDEDKSYRRLVARPEKVEVAPETKTISEGYAASLAFLSHIGSWLPDYTYYTAELSIRKLNAWQGFSGLDASTFKAKTGSHVSVTGFTFVAGAAMKAQNALGDFLVGLFVEGGRSNYEVFTDIVTQDLKEAGGSGKIGTLGVGLMASQKFGGLRLETSLRYGKFTNEFTSTNYTSFNGTSAGYTTNTPYIGGHVGLGYAFQLGGFGSLDVSAKYYMNHINSQDIHIGDNDVISYDPITSRRLRGGVRFTKPFTDTLSFYFGSHYDYEFDNQAKGHVYNMDLHTVGLKGGTGIFELGGNVLNSSNEHLSLEFGVQAYAGIFRGFSGGVRVGYEF